MKISNKESEKEAQKPRKNYYGQFNIREGEITKDRRGIALQKTDRDRGNGKRRNLNRERAS